MATSSAAEYAIPWLLFCDYDGSSWIVGTAELD